MQSRTSWFGRAARCVPCLALIGALLSAPAFGADKISLRLDWSWWPGQAPFLVAQEKGLYKEAGLEVDVQQGQGSKTTTIVVGEGKDQIGHANLSTVAQSISAGVPIKAVAGMWQRGPIGLICDAAAGVKNPSDLKGKKIGSTPTGSDAQVLPAFLGTTGLESGDLTIVNMQGDAKLAALMTDKVDCISGDGFFWAPRAEAAGKEVDIILYADHGVTNLAYGIIAGDEFLKSNPDVVRRFLAATMKGYAYTFANIEEAADIFFAKTGSTQSREFVVGTLRYYKDQLHTEATAGKPMGWMAEEDWESMNAALKKFGGMTGRKPASEYHTNEFLPSS